MGFFHFGTEQLIYSPAYTPRGANKISWLCTKEAYSQSVNLLRLLVELEPVVGLEWGAALGDPQSQLLGVAVLEVVEGVLGYPVAQRLALGDHDLLQPSPHLGSVVEPRGRRAGRRRGLRGG